MTYISSCWENHRPPPNVPEKRKIGTIAGWELFSVFSDNGGYGVSQSILDDIADLVETYQNDEFTPRQDEANEIWDWLEAVHNLDPGDNTVTCGYCGETHTYEQSIDIRNTKIARLSELGEQIDEEWCNLSDIIRDNINSDSVDAYDTFIEDVTS